MSWILDHIQICIAIAVMIAAWMKKLRDVSVKKSTQQNRTLKPENALKRDPQFDAEAAERTRKIQDEIRRKIEERTRRARPQAQRNQAMPPLPQQRQYDPFSPESLQGRNPPEIPRPAEPARVGYARDEQIARKLEAARQREEKRKAKASAAREDTISIQVAPIALIPSAGAILPAHPMRESLANPDEVRRAIVLSEILQPPGSLR